jgi:cyanophycinase
VSPAKIPDGATRGYIIPIGGAEDKEHAPVIHRRFIDLCGGADARIIVIPTASKVADTGDRYVRMFKDLGAGAAERLDFDSRRDCSEQNRLDRIAQATGIFITGGNQLRLTTILGGTPVAKLIRQRNAEGVHVAGTSAGAAFLSEHMIAFGEEGSTPLAGKVTLAPGLGLTNRFVIDQHFRQRDRLGRLLTALAYNPYAHGIGLDENTAVFIGPDNVVEVEGSGAITIVDASGLEFSSMDLVDEGDPICLIGLVMHVLVAGATYNLHTREAFAGALVQRRG